MTLQRKLAILLLVLLTLVTVYAVADVGFIGIFRFQLSSPAGWQVLFDLIVALVLLFMWLIPDAKAKGRNPWIWVAVTCVVGSFGPLLYVVTEKK
ncbi:DUF2834 domain-containing protein [Marinomonas atlantica]|uniref:DUF2834 domain-containing protein n=1 Tax=Marinomonas atlantica TaxID=1806668 RepID=UPI0008315506|nr:DUF2834 domain-containing protein [Marinomonas atlantica]